MADIVRIKDRMGHRSTTPAEADREAVVLMFTGVRYEKTTGRIMPSEVLVGISAGVAQHQGPASGD